MVREDFKIQIKKSINALKYNHKDDFIMAFNYLWENMEFEERKLVSGFIYDKFKEISEV